MKFPITLLLLFSLNLLFADNLEVQVNTGFCLSEESGHATIIVAGGEAPYTYEWSDPSLEGDEVFDLSPGDYSLTVTDATGCEVTETFELLAEASFSVEYLIRDVSCYGANDGKIFIDDFSPSDLLFSLDGTNFSDDVVYENLAPGTVTLYFLESSGCITEQNINIYEPFELVVDLGEDIEVELGDEVELSALVNSPSSIFVVDWNVPDSVMLSCENCLDPSVFLLDTTTIVLTIEDGNGCQASDEITVFVSRGEHFFVPNIFTPNGDGTNDRFLAYGGHGIAAFEDLIIRDNFGSIVFRVTNYLPGDYSYGWDGTFKGRELKPGVFIYRFRVQYIDGFVEEIFGTVTLIR